MRSLRRFAWALLAVACGCAQPPGSDDGRDAGHGLVETPVLPITLELGTGRRAFIPFLADEPFLVQRGCQGSQHVYVSLRAQQVEELLATVELTLARVEDGVVVSLPYRARLPFKPGEQGAEVFGLMLIVPDPEPSLSKEVRIEVSIEASDRIIATSARVSQLQWGADACP